MITLAPIPRNANGGNICCGDTPVNCECAWTEEQLSDAIIAAFFDSPPIAEQYLAKLPVYPIFAPADGDPNDGDVPSIFEYLDAP